MRSGHSSYHDADRSQIDEALAALKSAFIVFREPSPSTEPTEGSFDYPTMRQNDKIVGIAALDDFNGPMAYFLRPGNKFSGIAAVSPDKKQARKQILGSEQEKLCSVPVLDIGRMDNHKQYEAKLVSQNMALASRYFFPAS